MTSTTLSHRTTSNIRAAFAIIAFTLLAAIGFAAGRQFDHATKPATSRARSAVMGEHARAGLLDAPAAAPLSTSVFRGGF